MGAPKHQEGGWIIVPGIPDKKYFQREDIAPHPGRLGQIGDVLHLDPSNSMGVTPDNDEYVKVCIRHDAIFFLDADHDGRLYLTDTDASKGVLGTGTLIKGELAGDPDLKNTNTGHKNFESVNFRPVFWFPGGTFDPVLNVWTMTDGLKIGNTELGTVDVAAMITDHETRITNLEAPL